MTDVDENQDFTVAWSIKLQASDAEQAANKAHDVLRSRQPVQLSVFKGSSTKSPLKFIPHMDEYIASAIKRFFPTCTVDVDGTLDDEAVTITVVATQFRDLPHEDERIAMTSACLSSLPEKILDKFEYTCMTPEEYELYGPDGEGWSDDDSQPGGEGPQEFDSSGQETGDDLATTNENYSGKLDV